MIDPQKIVETYQSCGSTKETAKRLGCSQNHVCTILWQRDTPTQPRRKIDRAAVLEAWHRTQDTELVAQEVGASRSGITRILLKEFGIHVPYTGERRKYNLPMDELAARYLAGETCGDIARSLGLPSERIRRRLKNHGVTIRSAAVSVPRGKKNIFYKNGKGKAYRENKYQSRKAAAAFVGGSIPEGWVVHHIDGDVMNLDPKNMLVFPGISQHSAYHTQLLSLQKQDLEVNANQLASENGGLTLPQLRDLMQSASDTDQLCPSNRTA